MYLGIWFCFFFVGGGVGGKGVSNFFFLLSEEFGGSDLCRLHITYRRRRLGKGGEGIYFFSIG